MRILFITFSFFILLSCNNNQVISENNIGTDSTRAVTDTIENDSLILTLTKQILTSIKNKDFKTLSEFMHPISGVRFSPYGYIDTLLNVRFTADSFINQIKKGNKIKWGSYDGSGNPILLTIDSYFSRFVYDVDFLNAEKTSLNKMIANGNSLNNLITVYKGCEFTESYFSGFDKVYEGMDWRCLRLVYKKHLGKMYLIGIVHDQWTI